MKNLVLFSIAFYGLFLIGCNPMEDINNEIDKQSEKDYIADTFTYNRTVAPKVYVLEDDDYELSSNTSVAKYKNFSASALPKDFLPEILNKKFVAANAFEMTVTYNYYSSPAVDKDNAHKVDSAEYMEMGQNYLNFSDEAVAAELIGKMLDRKFVGESGNEMTVAYTLFSTNMSRYVRVEQASGTTVLDEAPAEYYTLDTNDYAYLGQGKYDNFTSIEIAQELLPGLASHLSHNLPQTYECAVYKNYITSYKVYMHNGSNWVAKQSVMEVSEPLNYALNSTDITLSSWWADPAIKITLNSDDYSLFTETGKYSNFDIRSGQTPGTNAAKLVEMIGEMLDTNYSAVENQQYLVYYSYYDGSNGVASIRIIKNEGSWSDFSE